jgi:hypothetical protein
MKKLNCIMLLIISAFMSCVRPENKPPEITDFICSENDLQVYGGSTVIFDCIATDPEGDKLSYNWSATSGTFNRTTSSTVIWTSPVVTLESVAQIKVEVTDSENPDKPQYRAIFISVDPIPIVVPTDSDPQSSYYIKYVCDDAYVDATNPNAKCGNEVNLFTGPGYYTYLRFDLGDIFNYINRFNLISIEKVEIRLAKGYNNTAVKPIGTTALYGISWSETLWYEELITYNISPQYGNKIAEKQNITFDVDGVVAFDVKTDFLNCVQIQGYYSIMVSTSSPSVNSRCSFYSKELKDKYPEYGDAATPVLWIKYKSK